MGLADFNSPNSITDTLQDPSKAMRNLAASLFGSATDKSKAPGPNTPWNNTTNPVVSAFWKSIALDPDRWNKLYPYRLLVIDVTNSNAVVNGQPNVALDVTGSVDGSTLNFTALGAQWEFNLPITPEQLSITDTFAINTTATLRGVLEEHNGAKFKTISASGTFGVWPHRSSTSIPSPNPNPVLQELGSIFGSTISAFNNVVNQVKAVANTFTTGHPANSPVTPMPEGVNSGSTGYYLALALQQFLEQYAEAKRDPKNAGWRLVFDIPKQNQSFIVTPNQFIWQQNVAKAMSISYSMQLKAWRRVFLNENITLSSLPLQTLTPGILQRILNTITQARTAVASAYGLISAVTSDITAPLNALRQTALLVKDLSGVAVTAADLGRQVVAAYSTPIGQYFANLNQTTLNAQATSNSTVMNQIAGLKAASQNTEGLSISAVAGGQLGTAAAQAQANNPAYNAFSNSDANFALFDLVPVNSLQLSVSQQNQVNNIVTAASTITIDQLKQYRATIQNLALALSNNYGSGSAYYNNVYGLPAPVTRITPLSIDGFDLLNNLYETMQAYDLLTATTQLDDSNVQTSMQYVAGLAATSGITFKTSESKIIVPVPFGLTMEQISLRYLDDPQRWLEIATLNMLRDPYIDEDGFQYSLLSNATGRQITVGDNTNLYLGQPVTLNAAGQLPTTRKILGIDTLSTTSFLLTLDGEPNLGNYTLASKAYIQAYLPGTVNSQQKIYIPSDIAVPVSPTIIMPSAATGDPLTGISQVDWLLTDSGDVAINNFGDFRLSYGLTNIIQALKIKMTTQLGTVLLHPDFGIGLRPGMSISDITAQKIYDSLNSLIAADPRFQGLGSLQIQINGSTLSINMAVKITNQNGVFPINFTMTI